MLDLRCVLDSVGNREALTMLIEERILYDRNLPWEDSDSSVLDKLKYWRERLLVQSNKLANAFEMWLLGTEENEHSE